MSTQKTSAPIGIDAVSVILAGEQTNGHLGLIDETLSPRFDGPPLHAHPAFDEFFFVVDGELTFQVGDELRRVSAGNGLLAPRGAPHTFANHSGRPARALIAVRPAGFERYFQLVSAELAGTEAPPEAFGPRPVTEELGPPIPRPRA